MVGAIRATCLFSFRMPPHPVRGQGKCEGSAPQLARLRPKAPLMCLNNRSADGEANPEASRLCTVEGSENAFGVLRLQSGAGILDRNDNLARPAVPRADPQLSCPSRPAAHGFNRVHHEVEDHLLQLDPISAHEWQALREPAVHRHTVFHELSMTERDDLMYRLVDLEVLLARGLFLDQGTDPPHDVEDAMAEPGDTGQGLPDFLDVRFLAIQKAQGCLRIGHCRCDRLVDLVRNRSGHLSERRDAVRVRQLHLYLVIAPLAVAQTLLRLLALAQIEHESDTFLASLFEARGTNQHGQAAAVLAEIFLLERRQDSGPLELWQPVPRVHRGQVRPAEPA